MKDADVSKKMDADEQALIESAQADLAKAKAAMKSAIHSVDGIKKMMEKRGLGCEALDAYAARTALKRALVGIEQAHVEASDRMMKCYPDEGPGIVLLGGGGR